jgi:exopolysaccharide production protein ExoQ
MIGFFALERERTASPSRALWIPVAWMILVASRPLSEWLQIVPGGVRIPGENLEDGPLERGVYAVLIALGLAVLIARGRRVFALLGANLPIVLLFGYGAMSIGWSDYPTVALTRWIKALGDLVMVLVVLTDREPSVALKRFLAWPAFLLVPISILFINYYPSLGRSYKLQNGKQLFLGVTNNKNLLGLMCLIFGLAAVWRVLHWLRDTERPNGNRPLIVHGAVLLMVLWLFSKANSMTSLACFVLASGLLVATGYPAVVRRRGLVHTLVLIVLAMASLVLFFDVGTGLVTAIGRDPTLTGRTELWNEIIQMAGNPMFGTGFESFWQGSRLARLWSIHWWHPNQAHNGYLEVFLNLGWTGLALLALLIVKGYRNAVSMLSRGVEEGSLRLAYVVVGIIYSLTEAGFRLMSPAWICLMLASAVLPNFVRGTLAATEPEESVLARNMRTSAALGITDSATGKPYVAKVCSLVGMREVREPFSKVQAFSVV